ncbi:MAG: hypothetical protein SV775_10235 [Thermodesulfobacteriota bacterium]|nr:hypothetical protein [Thermodesulfobacteriota bacterium]
MVRREEISSTEKLLRLIRSKDSARLESPDHVSLLPTSEGWKSQLARIHPFRKTITVGIDLGYQDLKLLKVRQLSDQEWELLGYTSFSFDPHIPKESPEFSTFIKEALTDFCGSGQRRDLWCLMSAARVEIRHIRIPVVPKKQIANTVYWTFKKEVPFDEKQSLFDFEVLGQVSETGGQKLAVTAYTAPRSDIKRLRDIFSKSGFALTGISVAPFAIQNLLRTHWIDTDGEGVSSIYVGRNWSRIDIFASGNLILTRGIRAGMNGMIEGIIEGLHEMQDKAHPESAAVEHAQSLSTADGEALIDTEQARKILFSLSPDFQPLSMSDPGFHLDKKEIFAMVLPGVDRLARQIERTFEYYSLDLGNESVSKIYLAGEITSFKGLVERVSNQVGLPFDRIDPLAPGNPFMSESSTSDPVSERVSISFGPSVGMALSHNSRTPNFIFTSKDKERLARATRINRGVFIGFIAIMVVCIGIFLGQSRIAAGKKSTVAELRQRLEQSTPFLDQNFILMLTAKAKQKRHSIKEYGRRYLGMAVIGELTRLTPSNVRLFSVTAKMGQIAGEKEAAVRKSVVLKGIISGDRQTLEASLADYLLKLESCPLFGRPDIRKDSFEFHGDKESLRFTVQVELV